MGTAPLHRTRVVALASVLVVLVVLAGRGAVAAEPGCGTPEECFARFVERQGDVRSVTARFRQVKHVALLREPLESRGRFAYSRDGGVRWEVEEPERMVVEIRGEELRAGPPGELRAIEAGSAAGVLTELGGLFAGTAQTDRFAVTRPRGDATFRLEPRDPSLARLVVAVEVDVDPASGAPRRVEIEEAGGDRTRIEMTDVEVERESEAGTDGR